MTINSYCYMSYTTDNSTHMSMSSFKIKLEIITITEKFHPYNSMLHLFSSSLCASEACWQYKSTPHSPH